MCTQVDRLSSVRIYIQKDLRPLEARQVCVCPFYASVGMRVCVCVGVSMSVCV